MKKRILIIAGTLLLIVAVTVTCIFLLKKDNIPEAETTEVTVQTDDIPAVNFGSLKAKTVDELKKFVTENGLQFGNSLDKNGYYVEKGFGENIYSDFYFGSSENGILEVAEGYCEVALNEKTSDELENKISNFCSVVSRFFNLKIMFIHNIYDADGFPIDPYEPKSYELMLAGKAKFGLSARDADGSYWYASGYVTEDGMLRFDITHDFSGTSYEAGYEDIVLLEPTEPEEENSDA